MRRAGFGVALMSIALFIPGAASTACDRPSGAPPHHPSGERHRAEQQLVGLRGIQRDLQRREGELDPARGELLEHDERAVRELLGRPRWVQVDLRRAAGNRLRLRWKEQTVVLRVVGDVSEPVAPDLRIRRSPGRQHQRRGLSARDRVHADAREQHDRPALLDDTGVDSSELIGGMGCRGAVAVHHRHLPRAPTCELRDHHVHGVLRDEWNAEALVLARYDVHVGRFVVRGQRCRADRAGDLYRVAETECADEVGKRGLVSM